MRLIFIPINLSTVVYSFVVIEEHQSIVDNKPAQLFDTRKYIVLRCKNLKTRSHRSLLLDLTTWLRV